MSRKTKAQSKQNMEHQNMEMSSESIGGTAKDTLDTVVETVNTNKLLIASIAAGCGAAIFLLATEPGKRVRSQIREKYLDLYDLVSVQVSKAAEQLTQTAKDIMSTEDVQKTSQNIRRVA